MKTTAAMVLFWGTSDIYSNWHASPFILDGIRYLNVEQAMMAGKARLFKDAASEQRILAASDPKTIKALGRGVQGYDDAAWVAVREEVVFQACLAKFDQNPALRKQILATEDRLIVEASPVDNIWGIGLAPEDLRALDVTLWRGLNLLGIALMRVRQALRDMDKVKQIPLI